MSANGRIRKPIAIVMALVLALGLCPIPAFATGGSLLAQTPLTVQSAKTFYWSYDASVATPTLYLNSSRVGGSYHAATDAQIATSYEANPDNSYWASSPEGIDLSGAKCIVIENTIPLSTCSGLFSGLETVTEITGLGNLDVSAVENFGGMFRNCYALQAIDLSGWNAHKGKNFSGMFEKCYALTSADLSGLYASEKASNFQRMFYNCSALVYPNPEAPLDLSHMSLSQLPNFKEMFYNCTMLQNVSLPLVTGGKTSDSDLSKMFFNCPDLDSIQVAGATDWRDVPVEKSSGMFVNCISLKGNADSPMAHGPDDADLVNHDSKWDGDYNTSAFACVDGWEKEPGKVTEGYFSGPKGTLIFDWHGPGSQLGQTTMQTDFIGDYPEVMHPLYVTYGYNFLGFSAVPDEGAPLVAQWSDNRNAYDKEQYVTRGNATIYGQWSKWSYDITYLKNGGSWVPDAQEKAFGEDILLNPNAARKRAESDIITTLITAGGVTESSTLTTKRVVEAAFKGWNSRADGSGDSYQPGDNYTNNDWVDLYAQWGSDTVTYTNTTLPAATRANYEFAGWKDASGKIHVAGEVWKPTASTTLTAQWKTTTSEKDIVNMTSGDAKGSTFTPLQVKVTGATKNSVKLGWTKASGAAKYVVYGNLTNGKNKFVKVKETTGKSYNHKKQGGKNLKAATSYKFIVLALDKSGKCVAASKTVYAYTKGGAQGNVKSVTLNAKSKTLSVGKSFTLKGTPVKAGKKLSQKRKVMYESSDDSIASVNPTNGKVTAKKAGTAYIYAYACDGKAAKCKVTVK